MRISNFFIETAGRADWKSTTEGYALATSTSSNWVQNSPSGSRPHNFIGGNLIAPSSDQAQYSGYGSADHGYFNGQQFTISISSSVAMPDPHADPTTDLPVYEFFVVADAASFSIPAVTGTL